MQAMPMAKKQRMLPNTQQTWRDRIIRRGGPTLYATVGVMVLGVLALLWILIPSQTESPDVIVEETTAVYTGSRHPLTGARVEEDVHPAIYAVVIENAMDARPQDGVDKAFLVMEAPVEGDITRWLAFFSTDEEVEELGPVRSARLYFVEWAMDWDALFAHVGGSPEALALLRSKGASDVDEFFNTSTFWRSRRRAAPHNVYTESVRLAAAWERIVGRDVSYEPLVFDDMEPIADGTQKVHVSYGNRFYDVAWQFDPETNRYTRYQDDAPHAMRDGSVIEASNVIVLFTDIRVIDDEGRKRIRTEGTGDALLMRAGSQEEVEWRRDASDTRTHFVFKDGEEATLVPGKTWIHVVPIGANVFVE